MTSSGIRRLIQSDGRLQIPPQIIELVKNVTYGDYLEFKPDGKDGFRIRKVHDKDARSGGLVKKLWKDGKIVVPKMVVSWVPGIDYDVYVTVKPDGDDGFLVEKHPTEGPKEE